MLLKNPVDTLKKALPPFVWLPQYDAEKLLCDIIAGITVGLTLVPQSIAYAALAGLGPEYGLYSSLSGGIIYAIFGTIPQLNIAPTALLSLLTFTYTHSASFGAANAATLLCFLAGVIELACGILHLGFLVDFVSVPVVAGFTSAGAVTIASAQVKNLMGLNFSAETFVEVWRNVFEHISEAKLWDSVLSVVCCFVLLTLRHVKDYGVPPITDNKKTNQVSNVSLKKAVWFISVSRNAIVVVACAAAAYILDLHNLKPFSLTPKVPSGLPSFSPPLFYITENNHTYHFDEMVKELGSGIFVVPFVAILSNIAIAKAFAQGKVVDASQEMLAVGFCSIFGSFLSSWPVNASFSRAAVGSASGTRTPLAGIYTGVIVILALILLTPYFSFIPKATLASVIICAVIFMVEASVIRPLWKINRIDMIPLFTTFFACLAIGIEIGILVGVLVDAILLLYYSARPKVEVETIAKDGITYVKIAPDSALFFPAMERIRDLIVKTTETAGDTFQDVVIDCSRVSRTDFTAAKCMSSLCIDLEKNKKRLVLLNAENSVKKSLAGACNDKCVFVQADEELVPVLKGLREHEFNNGEINSVEVENSKDLYKDVYKGTNL